MPIVMVFLMFAVAAALLRYPYWFQPCPPLLLRNERISNVLMQQLTSRSPKEPTN